MVSYPAKNFYLLIFILYLSGGLLHAQPGTYILNGSATQNSCNCYTLTPPASFQSGSVWNATKINLNIPFDYIFNVFPGCNDANGADGMVFILQPISTSVGTSGEGMGFEGVTPSIGITLDTYQNANRLDPDYDHISIQRDGLITHGSDLAGPIQASSTNPNIEDCQWHTFRISWDPATFTLRTYFDGVFRLQTTLDLVTAVFNNDPMVYWGFSGATGGSVNQQQFCTALNPGFSTSVPGDATCLGTPVTFSNTSQSFAPVASLYWDFGDNTSSTLSNPPPHIYTTPGKYLVKLAITGLDGCFSDTLRKEITVGDYPVSNFDIYDTCFGEVPRISDRSQVQVGTISQWSWELDGSPISTSQIPMLGGVSTGPHQLALTVTSNYGCASARTVKPFTIHPKPNIRISADDGCVDEAVFFTGEQLDNATTIASWLWDFGDNQTSTLQSPQHTYNKSETYIVKASVVATNGCKAGPIDISVFINKAIANAGNDTMIIKDIPFQLQGSGGAQYSWSPGNGLSNTNTANPVATLSDDITYTLTVTTAEGCTDEDEVKISVFKGSAIFVPNAFTPNNDGKNETLKPYYIGIKSLDYFTVFNRWGEKVFTTKSLSEGWNGLIKGAPQATGTYVWMVRATDFAGKVYQLNGTSTIIR